MLGQSNVCTAWRAKVGMCDFLFRHSRNSPLTLLPVTFLEQLPTQAVAVFCSADAQAQALYQVMLEHIECVKPLAIVTCTSVRYSCSASSTFAAGCNISFFRQSAS
jgi:hypothetical protein